MRQDRLANCLTLFGAIGSKDREERRQERNVRLPVNDLNRNSRHQNTRRLNIPMNIGVLILSCANVVCSDFATLTGSLFIAVTNAGLFGQTQTNQRGDERFPIPEPGGRDDFHTRRSTH